MLQWFTDAQNTWECESSGAELRTYLSILHRLDLSCEPDAVTRDSLSIN
jgi:hypothetical protein